MTRDQLLACTKKRLTELARRAGVPGWHGMTKDELGRALAGRQPKAPRAAKPGQSGKPAANGEARPRVQVAAARNTSGSPSSEEQIESSKYDTGVPTRDLSSKVPRDLPSGDRIASEFQRFLKQRGEG